MALIKGKQIATGANGIATANLQDGAVNKLKSSAELISADGARPLTADWAVGGFKITGLAEPTGSNHAATKAYVDATKEGLDVKDSVRLATAAALPASTYNSGTKRLTASANGALSVDGVAVAANDRILVKDQATGSQNGIYKVIQTGDAGNPWILERATDFDSNAEITAGAFTFVEEGNTNADSGWVLTTNATITLDTTSLTFTQFSGAGQITAGAGLTKTGNTLDVGAGAGVQVNADSVEVIYGVGGDLTTVDAGSAAAAGALNKAARADHEHAVTTGAAVGLDANSVSAEGSGAALARAAHTHSLATGIVSDVGTANAAGSSANLARADHTHRAPKPTTGNKKMAASATSADGQQATATTVAATPALSGYVGLRVNGIHYNVGDGTKVSVDCYFSGDNGTTARAMSAIVSGDKAFWNGSVAGFELAATDEIDFEYETF